MLSFFVAGFAVAALLAATGPVLIHFFNRRRYRTVDWAAMDFLREALRRNRKVLQIRDLLILALRVAIILFFGFALARPFLSSGNASLWPLFGTALALLVGFGAAIGGIFAKDRNIRLGAGILCALATIGGMWGGWRVVQAGSEASAAAAATSRSPIHAVLLVDNSLSMGYESLEGTLLDQAKTKAIEFLDQLPAESRFSVIPLCGSESAFTLDAYRNREEAFDALRRIEVVPLGASAASVSRAIELAQQACAKVPELEGKRVVLLSDQQSINWPTEGIQAALKSIPELQVVQLSPSGVPENLSIAEFRIRDGIADVETPASFLVTIDYQGREPLASVLVTLTVDGSVVASQTVEMQPDQSRQVEFKHQFDVSVDPGQPAFVPATVTVSSDAATGDALPLDNARHLAVPVVAGIPVVFVDQFGAEDEDAEKNRLGETYALRRLLAPRMTRDESRRQLIRIRHTTINRLERDLLEDARFVVVAGVASPGDKAGMLREYVLQGGRLMVAAGGEFDPVAWNDAGWKDGAGILPLPLKSLPLGETPAEASRKQTLDPFFLSFPSLQHDYFLIEGESQEYLKDFYNQILFFKAVQADASPDVSAKLLQSEAARIDAERTFLSESRDRLEQWAEQEQKGLLGPSEQSQRADDEDRRRAIAPNWLLWRRDHRAVNTELPSNELAHRSLPRVLGRFTRDDVPFLVERSVGEGRMLFVGTSIFARGSESDWNNLTKDAPVLLFDRIIRTQLEDTLPARNFDSGERITIPVERNEQLRYTLQRPEKATRRISASPAADKAADEAETKLVKPETPPEADSLVREESLTVDALGPELFGVNLATAYRAGHYRITARRVSAESSSGIVPVSLNSPSPTGDDSGQKQREVMLAVNGPASESDLRTLDATKLKERLGDANYRWIERDEPISLEGAQVRGRDMWKWLAGLALCGLLLEMLVLSWPQWMQAGFFKGARS